MVWPARDPLDIQSGRLAACALVLLLLGASWARAAEVQPAETQPELARLRQAVAPPVHARALRAGDLVLRTLRDAPPGTDVSHVIRTATTNEFGRQRPAAELDALDFLTWAEAVNGLSADSREIALAHTTLRAALRDWSAARDRCRTSTGGRRPQAPTPAVGVTDGLFTEARTPHAQLPYPKLRRATPPFCDRQNPGGASVDQFQGQIDSMMNNNLMFLAIQTKVQNLSQTIQLISNIMKADSDAKLNAIRNVRP